MRRHIVIALAALCLLLGCDTDRINRLEKENVDLKAAIAKTNAATDFNLQEKCSNAAKSWFRENYPPDKDTVLLDETNHYNQKMNKCFVMVEYHYNSGGEGSWYNDLTMWDVFENSKYASFTETHVVYPPQAKHDPDVMIVKCEVGGTKCKTVSEFNSLTHPYMND